MEIDKAEVLRKLSIQDLFARVNSSKSGISEAQALESLKQYGPNELLEKKTSGLLKFFSYFWGPIPAMIEIALVLSLIVKHWPDFFIILLLLFSNAAVGFFEEYQAGNAIAALKAKLAIKAKVKRDGKLKTVLAKQIVPGDVILLCLGDIVPADAKIISGDFVEVDQSSLTGESLPVEKKEGDVLFSGSIIKKGEVEALVYGTGLNTYFGKTANLTLKGNQISHFQKAVLKIGNYLIALAILMVAVIIVIADFRGDRILTTLQFALVLTVAAIPVALPTVLSVTMAVGARMLAKKKAIVSRLVSIEELAGVDILCADKTGTMTQNKLTLGDPFALDGISIDEVILCGALASEIENDDPIDVAVVNGVKNKESLKLFQKLHFTPFNPVEKRSEAIIKDKDGKAFKVTKGAFQAILALVENRDEIEPKVTPIIDEFAEKGFRSLAVARCENGEDWKFLGVLPLFDPPRSDAKQTIEDAALMGVKIKMVTGDQLPIAKETSKKLGLGTNILDASGLGDVSCVEAKTMVEAIEKSDGFAQVFPEHKFHIVDVLQRNGHIVGMTGDGVNDAPALKKADCGIAVSGATDAARASASIVLMTPGLFVIIDAIKESRKIFQRMNSYAIYRIAETITVLLFMTLSILIFNFYPLTAVMIVMLALLNDGAILSIAYDNVLYKKEPEAWNMKIVLSISTLLGFLGVVSAFALFYIADRVIQIDSTQLQPMMYLMLSVSGHMTVFLTRTQGPFWSIRPANILCLAVVGTQLIATLIAVYGFLMTPLGWKWAGFVWAYAFIWALIGDRAKLFAYKFLDRPRKVSKSSSKSQQAKPEVIVDIQEKIAKRAYDLYEKGGHQDGHALEHWSQAEKEINQRK